MITCTTIAIVATLISTAEIISSACSSKNFQNLDISLLLPFPSLFRSLIQDSLEQFGMLYFCFHQTVNIRNSITELLLFFIGQ